MYIAIHHFIISKSEMEGTSRRLAWKSWVSSFAWGTPEAHVQTNAPQLFGRWLSWTSMVTMIWISCFASVVTERPMRLNSCFVMVFFPATLMRPETVFTNEVLKHFDIHHCTSTKSGESFCTGLQEMINSGQPYEVSVSLFLMPAYMNMLLNWTRTHIVLWCKQATSTATCKWFEEVARPMV